METLDAAVTARLLPFGALVPALREAFAADAVVVPERHHHRVSEDLDATLLVMPAWAPGGHLGVKLVNVFPGNRDQGLPGLVSAYLLSSATTGQLLAMLDGPELTRRRTAAASALAASYLAPDVVRRHLVVGAGSVAQVLPEAYAAVRDVGLTQVFNRTRSAAEALVERLRAAGRSAEVVEDLSAAIAGADVVSTATLSGEPLVHAVDVRPGTHVDLIGGFTPLMREADDALVGGASVFVDVAAALHECGDLAGPIGRGVFRAEQVRATLADLAAGRHLGRTSAEEVTVFKSVGTAVEDLVAATLAVSGLTRTG